MIETDRMLEGIARTLESTVLPALGPGFARGQLQAVLDLLGNMQGATVWGGFLLEGEASSLGEVIAVASAAMATRGERSVDEALARRIEAYASMPATALGDRLAEGRSILCALVEAGLADDGELAKAIDSHLANDAILKAMALRPTRLAEISQG